MYGFPSNFPPNGNGVGTAPAPTSKMHDHFPTLASI